MTARSFTSAGSAAGLDLCLHIVRNNHGTRIANTLARRTQDPDRQCHLRRRGRTMQRCARVPCWSGKLEYFDSDACELIEARAGVSGQQDPAGCGGRGGDHHVVCGSRPSFRHRCYRQARMHPGDAHVVWLDGKAGQDCLHADGGRLPRWRWRVAIHGGWATFQLDGRRRAMSSPMGPMGASATHGASHNNTLRTLLR
jgi:hypothetical protein